MNFGRLLAAATLAAVAGAALLALIELTASGKWDALTFYLQVYALAGLIAWPVCVLGAVLAELALRRFDPGRRWRTWPAAVLLGGIAGAAIGLVLQRMAGIAAFVGIVFGIAAGLAVWWSGRARTAGFAGP